MLPNAFITHATHGRVRIKIPAKKGDAAYFASLRDKLAALSELPGIQRIEANPLTGSILVLHTLDPEAIDLGLVAQYSEFNQLFRLQQPPAKQTPAPGNKASGRTAGEIDPKVLAMLGFVGVAVIQLKRGHIMMPAITALWYAYSLMKERQREAAGGGE
ncbi:hypothetical protein MELA_02637 [Candidatus Methylomirabilis lanthanidiphila]|uniref:HMA domain-containing protein n=1 Tax=Candidatus Methylomirabilis lanthanidiphila TaxID=2211376 RepID=A0A564ZMZ6_9BACT|nr:hypothetical protein [Candidatus Methylomirabilis lanthanidiphila]VUZ86237.1 hypothetical protein MELA_02637 [Candidatus Methylomirabilis lanthanidiphila]